MAIYHIHAEVIGRSSGASAVAASAYRAGARMDDREYGVTRDYERRGGVERDESRVLLPESAPRELADREYLWNEVERCERRGDAQLARSIDAALPRELSRDEQVGVGVAFGERLRDAGMCVQVDFHDLDGRNPHVHYMCTMREVGPDGFGRKEREWNSREFLRGMRDGWERECNRGIDRRNERAERAAERDRGTVWERPFERVEHVDARSYEERGIDREPTRHVGKTGTRIERDEQRRCEREGREYRPVTAVARYNEGARLRNELREQVERLRERAAQLREAAERAARSVAERARARFERARDGESGAERAAGRLADDAERTAERVRYACYERDERDPWSEVGIERERRRIDASVRDQRDREYVERGRELGLYPDYGDRTPREQARSVAERACDYIDLREAGGMRVADRDPAARDRNLDRVQELRRADARREEARDGLERDEGRERGREGREEARERDDWRVRFVERGRELGIEPEGRSLDEQRRSVRDQAVQRLDDLRGEWGIDLGRQGSLLDRLEQAEDMARGYEREWERDR